MDRQSRTTWRRKTGHGNRVAPLSTFDHAKDGKGSGDLAPRGKRRLAVKIGWHFCAAGERRALSRSFAIRPRTRRPATSSTRSSTATSTRSETDAQVGDEQEDHHADQADVLLDAGQLAALR